MKTIASGAWNPGLNEQERLTLVEIANSTLRWCVVQDQKDFDFTSFALTPLLQAELTTFVTLTRQEELRGCIGMLQPTSSLYLSVHENTVSAALHDHRFPAVRPEELPAIALKISILSPIRPINSIDEFRIGEHGIIMSLHGRRAVFLPEVAVEQGWNVEHTLAALSVKAGLSPAAWKEGAHFEVFSSVVLTA